MKNIRSRHSLLTYKYERHWSIKERSSNHSGKYRIVWAKLNLTLWNQDCFTWLLNERRSLKSLSNRRHDAASDVTETEFDPWTVCVRASKWTVKGFVSPWLSYILQPWNLTIPDLTSPDLIPAHLFFLRLTCFLFHLIFYLLFSLAPHLLSFHSSSPVLPPLHLFSLPPHLLSFHFRRKI